MVSIPNRFYRGIVKSPDDDRHPNFRFILVDTVKEVRSLDGEYYTDSFSSYEEYLLHNRDESDVFYGVYGSYWIDNPKSSCKITETNSLQEAIYVAEEIMGSKIENCTP